MRRMKSGIAALAASLALGCTSHASIESGGSPSGSKGDHSGQRAVSSQNIRTLSGYNVEPVVTGLSYAVDVTFSDEGEMFVAEAGGHTYGTTPDKAPPAQIVKIMPDGTKKVVYDNVVPLEIIRAHASSEIMPEGLIPPVTGVTWHQGKLYVSHRSRYSVLNPDTGEFETIINGLPSWGEFLNAKPIFDNNGKMIFFLSTQGNTGVIEKHWRKVINVFNKPQAHEVPCEDIELTGVDYPVPLKEKEAPEGQDDVAMTGAYVPLGVETEAGQVIPGQFFCNGAFYRSNPDGTNIERIAWGFRSSFGYRISEDGRLIMTQNSANPMPPRGVYADFETVYEVHPDQWYGWPDFLSGIPITDKRFEYKEDVRQFVLSTGTHHKLLKGNKLPIQPLARLKAHTAIEGMVFGRKEFGLDPDSILVAEMGSIVPLTKDADWPPTEKEEVDGPEPQEPPPGLGLNWPGFKIQLVNLGTGEATDFVSNNSGKPASASPGAGGLERPIQLEWGPDGSLYIVDFGVIEFSSKGMNAKPNTGVIWRVSRQ